MNTTKIIISLLLSIPLCMDGAIHSIQSLTEMPLFEEESQNILAAFDIDDTLTVLQEPAFQRPNFKGHHAELFIQLTASLSPEEKHIAFTIPLLTTPGELVESHSPLVIQELQRKGVKTIALTAAPAGNYLGTPIEDRRIAELRRVGIDFSVSFPEMEETLFLHFKPPIWGSLPLYKEGVIFTNDIDKGLVLIEFLKTLSSLPKEIVFVDDRVEHLHTVERALQTYYPEIQFHGFHIQPNPSFYKETDAQNFKEKWMECIEWAKEFLQTFKDSVA